MAIFDFLKKGHSVEVVRNEIDFSAIDRQIKILEDERDKANASEDLTPDSIAGKKRKYHYKDVNIVLFWQYSGQYGKSCSSIGMRRGDVVELHPPKEKTEDPEDVAINWKGIDIGVMKNNRLRSMVHQWNRTGLPVLAVVSHVGGAQRLLIEFAFYGNP